MNPSLRSKRVVHSPVTRCAHVPSWLRAFLIPCVLLSFAASGCAPEIEPDGRAVLLYVRNAQVGAPVRRLWPEGQAYVDEVLEAQAAYRKSVESLDVAEDLWPLHSEKWQSAEQIDKRITEFSKLLGKPDASSKDAADDASKDKKKPKSREELRQDVREAVTKVLVGVPDAEMRELDFEKNVWAALLMDEPPLNEAAVSAQLSLLEDHLALCKTAKESLESEGKGSAAQRMRSVHADLLSRILAVIDDRRAAWQAMKIEMETLLSNRKAQLDQEKEAADARLIRDLRYERDYAQAAVKSLKDGIEAFEKQAKTLTEEPTAETGA